MVNLPNIVDPAAGDQLEEALFSLNLTTLTQQESVYVRAAKKIEEQITQIEMEFFKKVHELEAQLQPRLKALTDKRLQIIEGAIPVSEDDVTDVPLVYELDEKDHRQFLDGLKDDQSSKGVPRFWLMALQNCFSTSMLIEDVDLPILEHLKNIDTEITVEPYGFILRFYFGPNEYFTNSVIEKFYKYKIEVNKDGPHIFDAPTIEGIESTPIQWKEGKNPVVGKDSLSLFKFFSTEGMDEDEMDNDHDIASVIRECIIPHASLYFTGEIQDDDDDYESSCGSGEDSDEENEMMED